MVTPPARSKTLPGDPPVEIVLRRSSRARRISLRVSGIDGRVTLTLPPRTGIGAAWAFVEARAAWIRAQVARAAPAQGVAPGAVLPVDGRARRVVEAPRAGIGTDEIRVRAGTPAGPQVAALLKARARARLQPLCAGHAAALGRPYGRITLRDTRSRWGSCSSRGDLMFSWRLILAPAAVLDYVAAHEVAHLRHMDHSPAFWATVEDLMPGWAAHRDWLRREGTSLHAWRFDD